MQSGITGGKSLRPVCYGTTAIIAGLILYLTVRNFVPVIGSPLTPKPIFSGILLNWFAGFLPSFLHAFGFALLSAACLNRGKAGDLAVCGVWGFVHVFLESLQHPVFKPFIPEPSATFGLLPLVERIAQYFRAGTFDPLDVLAALLGVSLAFAILEKLRWHSCRTSAGARS